MNKDQDKYKDHRTSLLEWETPEFVPAPRGKRWYITAGLIMTALVLYGLFTDNLTMAIVFILMAVVFLLTEKKEPKIVKMIISDMGVQYKGQFYPYHHINSFWLVYHPPYVQALYLRIRNGRQFKHLRIELNGQRPQEVRGLLLKEVAESEGAHEPVSDALVRILKLQ
ncbi:hypothetical protein KJ657_00595 [Patescibacteria group bacterium]|nr:hypothetical protein [Patescibacteria group bacterium]MBU1015575.1 hypothetical protein [Patescibacteria group bacterium]MBU1684733.1 hypothetical protein [Patescibacteria group bacterium]MBU1938278.1 hypothetical protein [Patescibacteria group bacterium]